MLGRYKMRTRLNCLIMSTAPVILAVTILVLLLIFNRADSTKVHTKLVIDQDGGADDAMAVFMAILYEKYFDGPNVVAITTTHGNVDEEQVFNNTQRFLNILERRNVPIYRGSPYALIKNIKSDYYFGYDGLGDNEVVENYKPIAAQKEHAAYALLNLSKRYNGNLVVVALGALTNIALAIRLDPNFLDRLSQLYVAAGNIHGSVLLPNDVGSSNNDFYSTDFNCIILDDTYMEAEFNAAMDAEAYSIVVQNGRPDKLTIIPFSQILTYQKITNKWREEVLGTIPTYTMQKLNSFERISFQNSSYWCLLDPSAMAIALNESSVVEETRYSINQIHLCDEDRGVIDNNFTKAIDSKARIVYKVGKDSYKDLLYSIFSADAHKHCE